MKLLEYNKDMEIYINRLHEEWKLHGKIILAIDFDDTISPWKFIDEDFSIVHDEIRKSKDMGAYLVVFTACKPDRYEYIKEYCKNVCGFEIDCINDNVIDLPYGNDRKIYYNHLLDDRSGLPYALTILSISRMRKFCDKHNNNDYLE